MSPPEAIPPAPPPPRRRGLSGFFAGVRQAGRDVVSVAVGKLLGPPEPQTLVPAVRTTCNPLLPPTCY